MNVSVRVGTADVAFKQVLIPVCVPSRRKMVSLTDPVSQNSAVHSIILVPIDEAYTLLTLGSASGFVCGELSRMRVP